ncbi:MAG: YbaB/EbfC family nucleoid-associated protein [Cyanobacteria bacterium J06641_5]
MTGKGFGFGLGKVKELTQAIQKAQQVTQDAQKIQAELEAMEIEGTAGDGLVKVIMSGNQEPKSVTIAPEALERGAEELSTLVTAAVVDAYTKSSEEMKTRMDSLTDGLQLPGM